MNRLRPALLTAAAAPLIALTVAACGTSGGSAPASAAPPTTANGQPAAVGITNTGLGRILVDSQGRTLYLFHGDTGTTSNCTGACATAWPPLRATGQSSVGTGANAALLGTTPRSDGGPQVTYNGHPVYLFSQDQKPGDTQESIHASFVAESIPLESIGGVVLLAWTVIVLLAQPKRISERPRAE